MGCAPAQPILRSSLVNPVNGSDHQIPAILRETTLMVMYLDEDSIRGLLRWDRLIAAMEEALADFSLGRVLQPVRNMLTIEEGKRYLGIMPAVAADAMGVKLVSFYPQNAGSGIPTHMAMILLFSA